MSTVNFTLTRTDPEGVEVPADGRIRFSPMGALSAAGFTASVGADGFEAVELSPTPLGGAWKVAVNIAFGQARIEYVLVPDAVEPIEYESLVRVDPTTLGPDGGTPDAEWYGHVDTLATQATLAAADARGSREAAEAAQDAAVESQDSAAVSATLSEEAADRSGSSAFNAGQSAAVALEHRDNAEGYASVAELAMAEAQNSATDAGFSEDAAAASASLAGTHVQSALAHRDAALAARDLSEAYATGFSIGDVTTVGPNDPADALISGDPGTQLLHLTLPSGPASNLTIVETTTGPETPGATGPQGLKGDKGDPGGWVSSGLGNTSLNGYTAPGVYLQSNGGYATLANNYPVEGATGVLTVVASYPDNTRLEQTYTQIVNNTTNSSRVYYKRTNYAGIWFAWRVYRSSRVDQTAGRAIYLWDDLNNREQLIYGDTGNRDLAGVMLNGWTGTWLRIRRVGYEVTLTFLGLNSSVATSDVFYLLPVGFRANTGGYHQGYWFTDTTVSTGFLRLTGGGNLELTRRPATAYAANLQAVVKWTTEEAWPVALPGNSGGSIPNL